MRNSNNDGEEENGALLLDAMRIQAIICRKLEECRKVIVSFNNIMNLMIPVRSYKNLLDKTQKEEKREKEVEELESKYKGSSLSAVPANHLKTTMLWAGTLLWVGSSCIGATSIRTAMRNGEQHNSPPIEVVRVILIFLTMAFNGSLLGLLMEHKLPKLSAYSGYVSVFSMLFALGMIALFTVMWVFERI